MVKGMTIKEAEKILEPIKDDEKALRGILKYIKWRIKNGHHGHDIAPNFTRNNSGKIP
jgi:hypothetical protein